VGAAEVGAPDGARLTLLWVPLVLLMARFCALWAWLIGAPDGAPDGARWARLVSGGADRWALLMNTWVPLVVHW